MTHHDHASPPAEAPLDFDPGASGAPRTAPRERPDHHKVISISLYTEDLDRLDQAVRAMKRKGHTKASRSSVLRAAMLQVDLDQVPRGV